MPYIDKMLVAGFFICLIIMAHFAIQGSVDFVASCQPFKDVNPPAGYQHLRELKAENGKTEYFWCSGGGR